jgi:aspartate kinase
MAEQRGGADKMFRALAAVLGADACEIYTDVDGVYTTDPRLLPEARRVKRISYDEMLELASLGAGVMHNRSIEFAKKFSVPIHVRSSFTDQTGTMILPEPESSDQAVCGAALVKSEAQVTIHGVPDRPGASLAIFSAITDQRVTVVMIVQNVGEQGAADISFTVPREELQITLEAIARVTEQIGAQGFTHDDKVSKLSVVGLGMAQRSGVADQMFRSLAEANVNIQMISTSEIKISVLIKNDDAQTALRVVHQEFALAEEPPAGGADFTALELHEPDAVEIVRRLQSMEELTVDDVSLDETQARVTISGVPDVPGVAADIFEQIAAEGIFVDMIVQSFGREGRATLSFTVPRDNLSDSSAITEKLAAKYDCRTVTRSPQVAKLSVSGIGMRSHTEVAIRMFQTLAAAGINVEMINTSEVRVNVVVEGRHAAAGLAALQSAFSAFQR